MAGISLEGVLGGVQMDLLWTNPAPSSSFSAKSVNIGGEKYDAFFVLANSGTCIVNKNSSATMFGNFNFNWGGWNIFGRNITHSQSNSRISFSDSKVIDEYGEQGSRNDALIPQKIYGIRL